MLVTLIPLFDADISVCAYSLFSHKENVLLNPSLLGTGRNDGAGSVPGFDVIKSIGLHTLSKDKEIFVSINSISVFSDLEEQCPEERDRIVLLIDPAVRPEEMYLNRLRELRSAGFRLAVRKLAVSQFEEYREILLMTDYVFLDHKKIDITKAKIYFSKIYPNVKLCAGNIKTQEIFEELRKDGGYQYYEGEFYRMPVTKGQTEVAPLKINYIELLNKVNEPDFELTEVADIIGRDTALVISMLKMVNRMSVNSEITSIRHAAAMLGQKELKKWINTAVSNQMCADRPNEITRLSLLRAKFAESLAPVFGMAQQTSELFLMGLFSVLDQILNKPMKEALEMVKVSKDIYEALTAGTGKFAPVLEFVKKYENADWQEVDRLMIIDHISMQTIEDAYKASLEWYRDLFD